MTTTILLVIAIGVSTYFFYALNNKVERLFAQLSVKNDNSEVIKAIESIDIKVDSSDIIKTVEGGVNEILVKIQNSTDTITETVENLTVEIHE